MENPTEQELEAQMTDAMDSEAIEVEAQPVAAQPAAPAAAPAAPAAEVETEVSAASHFEQIKGDIAGGAAAPLSALYGLSLPISIELGRTSMKVQEVLQLGRGSVIELDRLAGEPVDVYVGDRRFAEGEVVVLGENFGVRITRILPVANVEAA